LACSVGGGSPVAAAGSPTPKAATVAPADTAIPVEPTPEAAATSAPGGGGFACFGTSMNGVTCLTDAGWETYTEDNSELPYDVIGELTACPDGKIYAATGLGPAVFDGKKWKAMVNDDLSSTDYVACAPDGSIWFGYFGGVSRYADGAWESFASEEYASGEFSSLISGLEVAPDGTVWVATAYAVSSYNGSAWTEYTEDTGFEERPSIEALAVDSEGQVWAAGYTELYKFENGEWLKIDFEKFYSIRSLAADPQGRVWVNTDEGAYIYDGSDWEVLSYATGEIHGNGVLAAAFDGAGRTWLGLRYGIDILVGDTWTHYRMDNADLVDNDFDALAVAGEGPALPEPLKKDPGSLIGSVTQGGAALANAPVELCVEMIAMSFTGNTPCSDQPFKAGTKTDADGKFSFDGLPEGYYVVTIKTEKGWVQLGSLASERVLVTAGKETDLGELKITEG
jgi:ligand-binding sensor domain-containing protein